MTNRAFNVYINRVSYVLLDLGNKEFCKETLIMIKVG